MAELERRSAAINTRYMRAQDLLAATRAHLLMGSIYVRDALLDPDPSTARDYRTQLEESARAADLALQEYVPVLDVPEERERIGRLRRHISEFRNTLLQVLNTDSRLWRVEAHALLRTEIIPKRDAVMRVSEEVQALNRSAFVQQQADISALYALTQRRLWWTIGISLIASIGIARELHDEIGQVLTIKVELSLAQQAIEARARDRMSRLVGEAHPVQTVFRRRNDWIWRGC
jgi:hypothetical protein